MNSTEGNEGGVELTLHTPGPWRFEEHPGHSRYYGNIIGSYGRDKQGIENIRTITCQLRNGPEEERKANARLIAAAPKLLTALNRFPVRVDSPTDEAFRHATDEWWDMFALPAIREAEGRT